VSLFYLKVVKISQVSIEKLKKVCKDKKIQLEKNMKKEDVLVKLGKGLFGKEVVRIDTEDIIKYNNLQVLANDS